MTINKRNLDFSILILALAYLISVYYGGIIIKLLPNTNIIILKKILPEVIISILLILCIIKMVRDKGKVNFKTRNNIVLFAALLYFFIKTIIDINIDVTKMQFIYTVRDNLLPFIVIVALFNIKIDYRYRDYLYNILNIFARLTIGIGFILGVCQFILGPEWTSVFYTNTVLKGTIEDYGLRIITYRGLLRVPSITGHNVIFGICNVFMIYLVITKGKVRKLDVITIIIAVANIMLSNSRTAMLMLIVLFLFKFYKNFRRYKVLMIVTLITILLLTVAVNTIYVESFLFRYLAIDSLKERIFVVWVEAIKNIVSFKDLMFGLNTYSVGAGLKFSGDDFQNKLLYLDNMYLYTLLSYGLLGVGLLITVFLLLIERVNSDIRVITIFFILSFFIGGIFSNLLQGRVIILLILHIFLMKDYELKDINDSCTT